MRWTSEPLAAPRGNQTIQGRNRFTWAQFDRLPARVRQVIAFAPVCLGTQRATDGLQLGSTVDQVVRQEVVIARAAIRRETLDFYGSDHPSLRTSSAA